MMQPMLTRIEGRPATLFAFGVAMIAVAFLAMVLLLVRTPMSDLGIERIATDRYHIAGVGEFGDVAVQFRNADGALLVTKPLSEIARGYEPPGTGDQMRAYFARRDRLAKQVDDGGVQMLLPDGRALTIEKGANGFPGKRWDVWVILFTGLGCAVTGLWVFALRPREEATRALFACGIAYFFNAVTVGIYQLDNIALSGQLYWAFYAMNSICCTVIAYELIWLFARYPVRLVPRGLLWAGYALWMGLTVWGISVQADYFFVAVAAVSLFACVLISGLLLTQIWLGRADPLRRAALSFVGSSLLIVLILIAIAYFLPYLYGLKPFVPMATYNLLFLLFYLSLGVAVARYRLFDLGDWSFRVAGVAGALVLVLIMDAGLALFFGQTWTLSVALLVAAILWLPVRAWILRRTARTQDRDNIALLARANRVAFAPGEASQRESWRAMLAEQFKPLKIEPAEGREVQIADNGQTLIVPSPFDPSASALAFAASGTRLFGQDDVTLARGMFRLVSEVAEARRSYDRGAREERVRIARDLHDDVGARLMTGLHRHDAEPMRADIREALADMRLIIDGLSGQARSLVDVMADLRHETVNRLALATIQVEWPPCDGIDEDMQVDHATTRILYSVTRELVTNIIRHSGAQTVTVDCTLDTDMLRLSIADDGRGAGGDAFTGGNGLRNSRKRLNEVGGKLDLNTDQGTRISIAIPLLSCEQGMAGAERLD